MLKQDSIHTNSFRYIFKQGLRTRENMHKYLLTKLNLSSTFRGKSKLKNF